MRQALSEHPGQPVFVVDDATNESYVLVPAEKYKQLEDSSYDDSEPDPDEFLPLVAEAFAEDWNAPGMELYDEIGKDETAQ